jgi:NAD(P)-dependent dehydrogenase (short-subunit alcohol dehydrogenase family)
MRPTPDYGEDSYIGSGKLVDKVALVTGGDSGIGRAVALAFAREGASVAISYLDEHDDAEASANLVRANEQRALLLPGDLRDVAQCQAIVRRTVEELGQLDILVLNSAYQMEQELGDLTPEQIDRTFRTNIIAPMHIVQAALPHLKAGASILITGSVVAFEGNEKLIDYACTKAALHNLTISLSKVLAERGVRVNCVAPGPVWTPLIPSTMDAGHVARFGADTHFGRPAQPSEIAPSYVFLAADTGSFYTGCVLSPTGRTTSR